MSGGMYGRKNRKGQVVQSDKGLYNILIRHGVTPSKADKIVAQEQMIPEQHTRRQIMGTYDVNPKSNRGTKPRVRIARSARSDYAKIPSTLRPYSIFRDKFNSGQTEYMTLSQKEQMTPSARKMALKQAWAETKNKGGMLTAGDYYFPPKQRLNFKKNKGGMLTAGEFY